MDQKTLPGFRPQVQHFTDGELSEREQAKREELAAYEADRLRLERVIREHCADARDLLAPGHELPPLPAPPLPPGMACGLSRPLLGALCALWRFRGAIGLEASATELAALLWKFGVRASVASVRRAVAELRGAGALQVLHRVWQAPSGWRDASGVKRARMQVRSVYSLPVDLLTAWGERSGRRPPLCVVLLGCSRCAPKGFSDVLTELPEQRLVDKVDNSNVPAPATAADSEGDEGRAGENPPLGARFVRWAVALVLASCFFATLALAGCARAPLVELPDETPALLDGADDSGAALDGGADAFVCPRKANGESWCALKGDAASCAPGCPGGLCCVIP
jgi:hypothetical protein